jgi:L-serine dehydratase
VEANCLTGGNDDNIIIDMFTEIAGVNKMNVFDIIGPIMVGPSSSHTAGAARIGMVARLILKEEPAEVAILLHGSFAKTFRGHGTDRALVGGLLGLAVDDDRIKSSLDIAEEQGIKVSFETADLGQVHPNTACIKLIGKSGKKLSVTGSSIGGGNITITKIDKTEVDFTGQYYTLIVEHIDASGVIASFTNILASENINIAFMKVFRTYRGGNAIAIIESDQPVEEETAERIRHLSKVLNASVIRPITGD